MNGALKENVIEEGEIIDFINYFFIDFKMG